MVSDGGSNAIHGRRRFSPHTRNERNILDHGIHTRTAGQPAAGSGTLNLSVGSLSLGDFGYPPAGARLAQRLTETVAGERAERASHRPPAADPYFRFGSVSRILRAIKILRGRLRCIAIPSQ